MRDTLMRDAEVGKLLSSADLKRLCDPANYLGATEQLVDGVHGERGFAEMDAA